MSHKNYRKLAQWHDNPSGFVLNNITRRFALTKRDGFGAVQDNSTKIAADMKLYNGQWLGGNSCITWSGSHVYFRGKSFKICNLANSAIQCAFFKADYLVAICSGLPGPGFKIRIFRKSELINADKMPYNTLNTPAAEFLDCFNGFTDNVLYKDITVNKTATRLVLIGQDADSTGRLGSVIVYDLGAVSLLNVDWIAEDVEARFENEPAEFRHFCYWNDLHQEQFAYSTYFPVIGEINPKTTYYRGFVFDAYQELAIGINRYVDDITLLDGLTTSIAWDNAVYEPNPFYPGFPYKHTFLIRRTYSQRSKRGVFDIAPTETIQQPDYVWWNTADEIAYPKPVSNGLGGGDDIHNSNSFMLCYADKNGNMLYTYKTPNTYSAVGNWPITAETKIFKPGFIAESVAKTAEIAAIVSSPANVIGVI